MGHTMIEVNSSGGFKEALYTIVTKARRMAKIGRAFNHVGVRGMWAGTGLKERKCFLRGWRGVQGTRSSWPCTAGGERWTVLLLILKRNA